MGTKDEPQIWIRVDVETRRRLSEAAAADDRSITAYVRRIIRDHLDGLAAKNADR